MVIVDEKGRIFGIMNILDLAILSFMFILVASLFLYTKFPPQLKEHRDVVFQMYFKGAPLTAINDAFAPQIAPYAVGTQIFVPGTELIATYAKRDKAVITAVQKISDHYGNIDFLVTINGSLEVDAEGDILFNGNNVAPGNLHTVQIGTSYLTGTIWRVNYEHHIQQIETTIILNNINQLINTTTIFSEDIVFDRMGNEIGKVTTITEQEGQLYLTLSLQADVYDGEYFVSEMPIKQFSLFYFVVDTLSYTGSIVGVSP